MADLEIAVAPMHRLCKKAGAERVSEAAAKELAKALEEIGVKIAKEALDFAVHSGRKTIKQVRMQLLLTQKLRPPNTPLPVAAYPNQGYRFAYWIVTIPSGASSNITSNPYSFYIQSDISFAAHFELTGSPTPTPNPPLNTSNVAFGLQAAGVTVMGVGAIDTVATKAKGPSKPSKK